MIRATIERRLLEPVPALLLANVAGGLVLWRAHRSIARALSAA